MSLAATAKTYSPVAGGRRKPVTRVPCRPDQLGCRHSKRVRNSRPAGRLGESRLAGQRGEVGARQAGPVFDQDCAGLVVDQGRVEASRRDDFLGLVRAGPAQLHAGIAGVLDVLQPQVDALAGAQYDGTRDLRHGGGVHRPDSEQPVVNPDPGAVVRCDMEGVSLRVAWLDLALPADGKSVGAHGVGGRGASPVKVHRGVNAAELQPGEVWRVVVLGRKAGTEGADRYGQQDAKGTSDAG